MSQTVKLLRSLLQRGLELARSGEDVGEGALGERVVQDAQQGIGHLVQHVGLQLKIRVCENTSSLESFQPVYVSVCKTVYPNTRITIEYMRSVNDAKP